jgi:hypothetical protein
MTGDALSVPGWQALTEEGERSADIIVDLRDRCRPAHVRQAVAESGLPVGGTAATPRRRCGAGAAGAWLLDPLGRRLARCELPPFKVAIFQLAGLPDPDGR